MLHDCVKVFVQSVLCKCLLYVTAHR